MERNRLSSSRTARRATIWHCRVVCRARHSYTDLIKTACCGRVQDLEFDVSHNLKSDELGYVIPVDPESLLSYRQAAKLLAVSERSLWSMVHRGDLPVVRLGRSVRIRRATLVDWLRAREGVQE